MTGLMTLPDPRAWPVPRDDDVPLLALAAQSLAGNAAARATLRLELDALLDAGEDAAVQTLLREAPSAECYRHLQQMLAKLVNKPERGETVIARLFAVPLVIVAGAKKQLELPDALPDIAAVSALLEHHGVLGAGRNFGLGNALCSMETLTCLPPGLLRRWAAQLRSGGAPLELAGSGYTVKPGREQVVLRFLAGATVGPAHVPSVMETGSNVGAWGMPLTKLLASQLAQPGLDVLPIPRAPVAMYLAADAGRAAQIELAFSLFLSNTVRQFRMAVGDPAVVLSAHRLDDGGAELRVSLSSPFDESMLEGFRWPLYPADDYLEIVNKIKQLLDEVKLNDRRSLAQVVDDLNARGGRFLSGRDFDQLVSQLQAAPRTH
jgi:hypothetical protein